MWFGVLGFQQPKKKKKKKNQGLNNHQFRLVRTKNLNQTGSDFQNQNQLYVQKLIPESTNYGIEDYGIEDPSTLV
jgi:hypothetical protein